MCVCVCVGWCVHARSYAYEGLMQMGGNIMKMAL